MKPEIILYMPQSVSAYVLVQMLEGEFRLSQFTPKTSIHDLMGYNSLERIVIVDASYTKFDPLLISRLEEWPLSIRSQTLVLYDPMQRQQLRELFNVELLEKPFSREQLMIRLRRMRERCLACAN